MSKIKLSFTFNHNKNKRELIIEYLSDSDLTAKEHEQNHRKIIKKILISRPSNIQLDRVPSEKKGEPQQQNETPSLPTSKQKKENPS